jgi:hypothetical protein
MSKYPKWPLPFRFPNQNLDVFLFPPPPPVCATRSVHLIPLDLIIYITFGEECSSESYPLRIFLQYYGDSTVLDTNVPEHRVSKFLSL